MIWANFGVGNWQLSINLGRVEEVEEDDEDETPVEENSATGASDFPRDPATLTSLVDFGEPDEDAIGFRRPRTEPGGARV